jgi:S-adenosylmethionine decarboxylase proenzyme
LISTFGRHLVVEYHGCDASILDDASAIQNLMERAAADASATIVQTVIHRFAPQGVSVVVVIEESHLSIHTWPEVGYAAVDFYTCGECDPEIAHAVLFDGLGATAAEVMMVHRGLKTANCSAQMVGQRVDHASVDSSDASKSRRWS